MTRLRELLCAERSRNQKMTEVISSLKQDKELLQHELAAKAALICDFLQDKLRPGRVWTGSPATDDLNHYNINSLEQIDSWLTRLSKITPVFVHYISCYSK